MKRLRPLLLLLLAVTLRADEVPDADKLARFRAAREALRADDAERAGDLVNNFRTRYGRDPLAGDLLADLGLRRAARGWRSGEALEYELAAAALREFGRVFRRHPRSAEVHLALAELALIGPEADSDTARNEARLARSAEPSAAQLERLDRLDVRLAMVPGSASDPVAVALEFERRWPNSLLIAGIRFDRATVAFRRGDFAEAARLWEDLADVQPGDALAPAALRRAGEAWMQLEERDALKRAETLFGSSLTMAQTKRDRLAARVLRCRAQLRLGVPGVVLPELDALLELPLPGEQASEVRTLRIQALLELSGDDRERLPELRLALREARGEDGRDPALRTPLLVLSAEAVRRSGAPGRERDYLSLAVAGASGAARDRWFFRGGFQLAADFEREGRWRDAADAYQYLSEAGGPLGTEAAARRSRLRLERFLWEPDATAVFTAPPPVADE